MTSPDKGLSDWITDLAGEVHVVDNVISLMVSDFFIPVTMSLFLLYLWFGTRDPVQRLKNQNGVMCSAASLGLGTFGVHILNRGFDYDPWPRPFEVSETARHAAETVFYLPHDPSFPANIAAVGFGAAIGMLLYRPKASIPLFVLAGLWSFSRVYAGVHYPLDVLGGAAIGAVMAGVAYGLLKLLWPLPRLCFWIARKLYLS